LLPVLLVFLSVMMVSEVKYPSFKNLDWRAKRTFARGVIIILTVGFFLILWKKVLPVVLPIIFTFYLLYGFLRPHLSAWLRKVIEEEDDDE
jgi:CDP-diacylglycerol--serine O-phosphatidyltransferase